MGPKHNFERQCDSSAHRHTLCTHNFQGLRKSLSIPPLSHPKTLLCAGWKSVSWNQVTSPDNVFSRFASEQRDRPTTGRSQDHLSYRQYCVGGHVSCQRPPSKTIKSTCSRAVTRSGSSTASDKCINWKLFVLWDRQTGSLFPKERHIWQTKISSCT